MPRVRWTREEDERLLQLIANGKSWTLISAALKRSISHVQLHARSLADREQVKSGGKVTNILQE